MRSLKVHVLDVGQASSAVLDFGSNQYGIVDCGGGNTETSPLVRFIKRAIRASESTRILFLQISHLDLDHISAISALVADPEIERRIERVYCNELIYRRLLDLVRRARKPEMGIGTNPANRVALSSLFCVGELIRRRSVRKDFHFECVSPEASDSERYPVRLSIPPLVDLNIELWSPSQRLRDLAVGGLSRSPSALFHAVFNGAELDDWNTASIVMTVEAWGRRILFAGDATARTWREILERAGQRWVGADVVVAWHHGARLGSRASVDYDSHVWKQVLAREAKVVCVSCGSENPYGHPDRVTIDSVKSFGGRLFCTQRRAGAKRDGAPAPNDFVTMLLRSVSKSGLWLEDNHERCCGDITVTIDQSDVTVSCATNNCDDRVMDGACCSAELVKS